MSDRRDHDTAHRFWSRVDVGGGSPDECWEWQGAITSAGYGNVRINDAPKQAHRVAWWLWHGEQPSSNLHVCHHCDNRRCVNPHHLFLGTDADNMADKVKKGRQARGERMNRGTLTAGDVRRMAELFAAGETKKALAERFGVDQSTVSQILRGKLWRHVRRQIFPADTHASSGARNCKAKLSDEDVRTIRGRLDAGETQQAIANDYSVSQATISRIAIGKGWRLVS